MQALHTIRRLPVDLSEPIYAHYSLFKMGVHRSVLHYAEMLAPLVADVITANGAGTDWVLTSPTHHAIPCAANLLCWCIADVLKQGVLKGRWPGTIVPLLVDIRHEHGIAASQDSYDAAKYRDYSQLSWSDRVKSLRYSNHLIIKDAKFAGRAVVFINDINVTGAQQHDMELYFQSVNAATVHWLYIIDVEESLGKSEPQLEYFINNAAALSIDEFGRILADEDIRYTTKCIWRLMAYETHDLERLLRALDADRRSTILRLVVEEGRFDGDCFREKIELLRAGCK
jgi:hypothetical protein